MVKLLILEKQKRSKKTYDVCAGVEGATHTLETLAPLWADDIASLTEKRPPDEGYEWAVYDFSIGQHAPKKTEWCDLADEEGQVKDGTPVVYGYEGNTSQLVPGGAFETIGEIEGEADACGCLANRTCLVNDADLTTPITLAPNTAIMVCPTFVCVVVEG